MSNWSRKDAIAFLMHRSPHLSLLGLAYTAGVLAFASAPLVTVLWLSAAGVVTAVLVVLSLRFYHFWLSWLIWAVPAPAIVGTIIAQPMAEGVMRPATAMLLGVGVPLAVAFGVLWAFRTRLRGWLE